MNKLAPALLACALLAGHAQAQPVASPAAPPARTAAGGPAGVAQANTRATRQYYAGLIAGPTPRIAELTLFMTLLPKGGDLHHHYSGAIYAETYLDWLRQAGYCVYRADTEGGKRRFTIETRPKAELPDTARPLCLSSDEILDARNNDFYRELLMRWSDKDYDNHSQLQPPPDQQFFSTFGYFGPISVYDYNQGLRHLKARAVAENVQYIETMLRSAPATDLAGGSEAGKRVNALATDADVATVEAALVPLYEALAADGATQSAIGDYLKVLEQAAAGIDDADFKLRFQAYVSRNSAPAQVFAGLYAACAAAARPGGKLVGVNIVGPENMHVAMRDYRLHMRMFAYLKQKFPAVRLALHAGELALGMVPPEGLQSHIRDAVEIAGAQRIGHGVDIAHERDAAGLLRMMRERDIPVEVNLTSNAFILGVLGETHPLPLYRRHGVPMVISTDDPGVSRNNLTGEYVLYASRYQPGYEELKRTVLDSIRYSFLAPEEKTAELKSLTQRFAVFEARIQAIARDMGRPLPSRRPAR